MRRYTLLNQSFLKPIVVVATSIPKLSYYKNKSYFNIFKIWKYIFFLICLQNFWNNDFLSGALISLSYPSELFSISKPGSYGCGPILYLTACTSHPFGEGKLQEAPGMSVPLIRTLLYKMTPFPSITTMNYYKIPPRRNCLWTGDPTTIFSPVCFQQSAVSEFTIQKRLPSR